MIRGPFLGLHGGSGLGAWLGVGEVGEELGASRISLGFLIHLSFLHAMCVYRLCLAWPMEVVSPSALPLRLISSIAAHRMACIWLYTHVRVE